MSGVVQNQFPPSTTRFGPIDPADIATPDPSPHVVARRDRLDRTWRDLSAKLARPVSLDAPKIGLREAVRTIAEQIEVSIEIDEEAAVEEGVTLDDEIDIPVEGISAEVAFERLLERRNLTVILRGERLVLTTATAASEVLFTRVYPVPDLVAVREGDGYESDFTGLMFLIQNTTGGPWFDTSGIGGTMAPFASGGIHALAIRQDYEIHREIELLLHDLRQARPPAVRARYAAPGGDRAAGESAAGEPPTNGR